MIASTTSPISRDDWPSAAIVVFAACAASTAEPTTALASVVECAISRIAAPICSLPAETDCTFSDTCPVAPDTACAWTADSSADAAIWADVLVISSAAAASDVAESSMVCIAEPSESRLCRNAVAMSAISSRPVTSTVVARSPSASRTSRRRTRSTGPVTDRVTATASRIAMIAAAEPAIQISVEPLDCDRSALARAAAKSATATSTIASSCVLICSKIWISCPMTSSSACLIAAVVPLP